MMRIFIVTLLSIFLVSTVEAKELIGDGLNCQIFVNNEMAFIEIKNMKPDHQIEISEVSVILPTEIGAKKSKIDLVLNNKKSANNKFIYDIGNIQELAMALSPKADKSKYIKFGAGITKDCNNCVAIPFGIYIKAKYFNGIVQENLVGAYVYYITK